MRGSEASLRIAPRPTASRLPEGLRKGPTSAWVFQTLVAGDFGCQMLGKLQD